MGRSQDSFNKREKEKKRAKKREEKQKKKEERKAAKEEQGGSDLDSMIAYVDEHGNITDEPPDPTKKKEEINAEDIVLGIPKSEKTEKPSHYSGVVEFFDDSKGYGFIKEADTGEKYFVHVSGLIDDIAKGDSVTFQLQSGPRGPQAHDVKNVGGG